MKTALEPRFVDTHKSFYGKAYTEIEGGWGQFVNLYSYDILVARIGPASDGEFYCVLLDAWDYSPTTLRHVKEFLAQNGMGVYHHKRDIIADAVEVEGLEGYIVLKR